MVLGFTVPLFVLLGVESVIALLLLVPYKTVNRIPIELARASYTGYGRTITNTLAVVLVIMLASPSYDAYKLYSISHKTDKEHYDPALGNTEASTTLSMVMHLTGLGLLFVLRKLGKVMGEKERMLSSEAALIKQVKGLQAEYMRVSENRPPAGSKEEAEGENVKQQLEVLQEKAQQAEERAAAAEKAQKKAESNLEAVKSQAGGLEKEYDRLLADHDRLKRQAAISTKVDSDGPMVKKDN